MKLKAVELYQMEYFITIKLYLNFRKVFDSVFNNKALNSTRIRVQRNILDECRKHVRWIANAKL